MSFNAFKSTDTTAFDLGVARVFSKKEKKHVYVQIIKRDGKKREVVFEAMLADSNTCLGRIHLELYQFHTIGEHAGTYGSEVEEVSTEQSDLYYKQRQGDASNKRLNVLHIKRLDNLSKGEVKGIGTALMQAAAEYSYFQGCEGRLVLEAVYDAPPFYYKIGMRSSDEYINKILKSVANKSKLEGRGFGDPRMWKTPLAILREREQIRKNPIFPSTLHYLASQEEEIVDLFSKRDLRADEDVISYFLEWNRVVKEGINRGVNAGINRDLYGLVNLFYKKDRIIVIKQLLKLLEWCDSIDQFILLFNNKFEEIKHEPRNARLFIFVEREEIERAALRKKIEKGPLKHVYTDLLNLFLSTDLDVHLDTLLKLDERIDRMHFSILEVCEFFQLFQLKERILVAKKIISFKTEKRSSRIGFGMKQNNWKRLKEEVERQPSDSRLTFFLDLL